MGTKNKNITKPQKDATQLLLNFEKAKDPQVKIISISAYQDVKHRDIVRQTILNTKSF